MDSCEKPMHGRMPTHRLLGHRFFEPPSCTMGKNDSRKRHSGWEVGSASRPVRWLAGPDERAQRISTRSSITPSASASCTGYSAKLCRLCRPRVIFEANRTWCAWMPRFARQFPGSKVGWRRARTAISLDLSRGWCPGLIGFGLVIFGQIVVGGRGGLSGQRVSAGFHFPGGFFRVRCDGFGGPVSRVVVGSGR